MSVDVASSGATTLATKQRPGLWIVFVGFGALVVSLAQSLLIPVLPALPGLLDSSSDQVQWLLTATLLVSAISIPLLGRLGDMFGTRRMLLVALGAMLLGSLVCALSDDLVVLIVGRSIQGVAAGAIPLGISLLAGILPRARSGAAIAAVSAMLGVGGALGLPLAGFVAEHADFHVLFWVTAVGALIAFAGVALVVPERAGRSGGRVDVLGAVLLAGALVSLLLPLAESSDWGWGSAKVIGLLVLSAVFFAVLGWWQHRTSHPLIDLTALRRRPIVLTNVASLLFGFALFASLIGTAAYVQAPESSGYGFGSSMMVSGLVMLPSGLAMLAFAPVSARLIVRKGAPFTLALGASVVAIGWAMRIVLTGSLVEVVVGATVVGVGTAIGYAAMPSLINANTPADEIAAANGLNTLIRSVGSSLASALGGAVLASSTVALGTITLPSLGAYRELFAMCALAALLAAGVALVLRRGDRAERA
ncbi:MFS transporter [Cellulomonas sp. PhB150]|uniref:MFS transporter n=1 Tax=Cellulomonas sp. PhB150 TaxID=2485188 RepID=UPI000F488C88|nr:MFS transporter [Cellulomonas sp. PhB150]ROS31342.1 MFS transporter [Cellulomonas sp. PhB150]